MSQITAGLPALRKHTAFVLPTPARITPQDGDEDCDAIERLLHALESIEEHYLMRLKNDSDARKNERR
jgi:hypothetical protein